MSNTSKTATVVAGSLVALAAAVAPAQAASPAPAEPGAGEAVSARTLPAPAHPSAQQQSLEDLDAVVKLLRQVGLPVGLLG